MYNTELGSVAQPGGMPAGDCPLAAPATLAYGGRALPSTRQDLAALDTPLLFSESLRPLRSFVVVTCFSICLFALPV
jgi:hypothetical protein